jgi:hypothetical protein
MMMKKTKTIMKGKMIKKNRYCFFKGLLVR